VHIIETFSFALAGPSTSFHAITRFQEQLTNIECVRSGHAGGENNRIRSHWEKSFIFMKIDFVSSSNMAAMNTLYKLKHN